MAKALDATRHDMAYRRISSCSEGYDEPEITLPCTLYYCHDNITGEVNAQLSLSEHLLNDITDTIGRKSLIVSKLAMKLHLYRLLRFSKGVQPDRLH